MRPVPTASICYNSWPSRCGRQGCRGGNRDVAEIADRTEHLAAMAEQDTEVFLVLVCQIGENAGGMCQIPRKEADPYFGFAEGGQALTGSGSLDAKVNLAVILHVCSSANTRGRAKLKCAQCKVLRYGDQGHATRKQLIVINVRLLTIQLINAPTRSWLTATQENGTSRSCGGRDRFVAKRSGL